VPDTAPGIPVLFNGGGSPTASQISRAAQGYDVMLI